MADKIVAFICTHNACRGQIAEALARHAGYKGYAFYSAGSVTFRLRILPFPWAVV